MEKKIRSFNIIVRNGAGCRVFDKIISAKDENEAIIQIATISNSKSVLLNDGDTIEIEEV